ncbi:MAG: ATP-binding protein [Pseudonocardia sp.]|nr:ATP-binding protein [Pseudonocardia sp.]
MLQLGNPDGAIAMVRRHVTSVVEECIADFRVTIVNGPRQAGRTTLLRQLHTRLGGAFVTFDDVEERAAARDDPGGYLQAMPRPLFVDEVQRGGNDFVLAIKAAVDREQRRGAFVLSGSTRFLTVPTLSESLAGRAAVVELWPFSVAERIGAPPSFVDQIFTDPQAVLRTSPTPISRHEYLRLCCTGGFPEATALRSVRSRTRWFSSYLATVTQREVLDLARIRHAELLPRMFRLLAALTAQELNVTSLARDLGIDDNTVRSYLPLLETVFLLHQLPAWSRSLTARVKRRPKVHLTDTGLAAWLMETGPGALARPGNPAAGALLETFVVNELTKLRAAADTAFGLFHFQDRDGREIDCVLETPAGRLVGIEVKASSTVRGEDFRHLALMRDRVGSDFVTGIVFFTGDRPLPFGDRLLALPISLLWDGRPPPDEP